MASRFRPFSNGTEYMDWQNANCCRCSRYHTDRHGEVVSPICHLEKALSYACVADGTITAYIADRIGRERRISVRHSYLVLGPRCREKIDQHTKPPTNWDVPVNSA